MRMEKLPINGEMKVAGGAIESPIEDIFQYEFTKFGNKELTLERQVQIKAQGKNYRVDFLIRHDGRTVVIECDGEEFHAKDHDWDRDNDLVADGVSVVYRFPGKVIYYNMLDGLLLLAMAEPGLFDKNALKRLFGQTTCKESLKDEWDIWDGWIMKKVEIHTTSAISEDYRISLKWVGKAQQGRSEEVDRLLEDYEHQKSFR